MTKLARELLYRIEAERTSVSTVDVQGLASSLLSLTFSRFSLDIPAGGSS